MTIVLETLARFSLGAESIALFARVGWWEEFTPSSQTLRCRLSREKVEAGIPEDDPRNPCYNCR